MTYDDLQEARDYAEREVHDLRNQFLEICPEDEWDESMIQEMNDAENDAEFLQMQLDTGDFTD
jgi:hypothetical protein